jgi:hypothetical protein
LFKLLIFFGTSADVFVDICHFTEALFTSFPCSFSTTHFYCVLYLYNSPPSNHAYSTELTTNNMQANNGPSDRGTKNSGASNSKSDSSYLGDNSHSRNLQSRVVICGDDPSLLPSSGANASAIGTGRVQRKKTLTKKGQAFYSATSTVYTTVAGSASAASVAPDSSSAKKGGISCSARKPEAAIAPAASVAAHSSLPKDGTSRLACSRSVAMESSMLPHSNPTSNLVDDAGSNLDNQNTTTASCNVSVHMFLLYFDCIYVICIRYELYHSFI